MPYRRDERSASLRVHELEAELAELAREVERERSRVVELEGALENARAELASERRVAIEQMTRTGQEREALRAGLEQSMCVEREHQAHRATEAAAERDVLVGEVARLRDWVAALRVELDALEDGTQAATIFYRARAAVLRARLSPASSDDHRELERIERALERLSSPEA